MSSSFRRITLDLRDLRACDCELIKNSTLLDDTELPTVNVEIMGPNESLYAGELYKIQVQFPESYPFAAPIVTFIGPNIPVHPHIYSNGHICLSTLGDGWSPANTLTSLCLSLISFLGSADKKQHPAGDNLYVRRAPKKPRNDIFNSTYYNDKA